jgi:hypothetical protein
MANRSFRATGITAYLANRGTPEHAQAMTVHDTTSLSDRTKQRLTQDGGADCDMIDLKKQDARRDLTSCNSSLAMRHCN